MKNNKKIYCRVKYDNYYCIIALKTTHTNMYVCIYLSNYKIVYTNKNDFFYHAIQNLVAFKKINKYGTYVDFYIKIIKIKI